MPKRYRVGIVGLNAGKSWAAAAHVPALRALSDTFEIVGVANTTLASAQATAAAYNLPRAFANVAELANSPEVDIVTVTVRVPYHLEIVKAAVAAGKHVYCEWPLGNGLAEAEEMAALVRAKQVAGVVGTQSRVAPEILYLRQLIADGFVGDVLSTTLTARAGNWGPSIKSETAHGYLLDRKNGATMLTIPIGHTLAALRDVLGEIDQLSAITTNRRREVSVGDTGRMLPMTAPDQVLIDGLLVSGAPVSLHYRGGAPRGIPGLTWEINGSEGDIRVTGETGHAQMVQLSLEGGRGDDRAFRSLDVPQAYRAGGPDEVVPGNVARVYSRMGSDLRTGTRTAPNFADAVELHRLIEVIQIAADSGQRISFTDRA